MGTREDQYIDCFYAKYKGRVALAVGYNQKMEEIFPIVIEDDNKKPLGIVAMATSQNKETSAVHIFHLSAFKSERGNGSKILRILCQKADRLNVTLSLSPVPSPNGKSNQINSAQLLAWYQKFGFNGNSLLRRLPKKPSSSFEYA